MAGVVALAVVLGVLTPILLKHPSTTHLNTVEQAQLRANTLAQAAGCPENPANRVNTLHFAAPDAVVPPDTVYAATVTTTAGTFRIAFNLFGTPQSMNDFIFLADRGYYNCNTFDRVVPSGVVGTGDPTGTNRGSPGYQVPAEDPPPSADPLHQYPVGSVEIADSANFGIGDSSWFVVVGARGEKLPNFFAAAGRVISGMNVVRAIGREGSLSGRPKVIERVLRVTIQTRKVAG